MSKNVTSAAKIMITSSKTFLLFACLVGLFNNSFAQTKSIPLSGSCGFITNRNFGGWDLNYQGSQTVAQNFTGIINFDAGTMFALANVVSNYGKTNAFESQLIDSTPTFIAISNGPFPGSHYLTAVGESKPAFILIPVNGGNTFLMTELNTTKTSSTGVCQKI